MATAVYLADPYTVSFTSNAVTITWGSGLRGPVTFEASNIDYKTFSNTRLVTISSGHNDDTTVDSTVATNTGGFATAALLIAYITANIIPAGSVIQLNPGTGITLTPNPITGTGSIATAADYSNASNITSGTLAAARLPTISLTSDVTGSLVAGTGATTIANNAVTTAKINNNAVTLAKLATQAATTLLGNATGGAAVPAALTVTTPIAFSGSSVIHATAGTAGTYAYPTSITTDATGHVTSVTAGSASALPFMNAYRAAYGTTALTNIPFTVFDNDSSGNITWNSGTSEFTLAAGTYLLTATVGLSGIADPGASFGAQWIHVNGGGAGIGPTLTLGYGNFGAYTGDWTGTPSCQFIRTFASSATLSFKPYSTQTFAETNVSILKIA